MKLKTKIIAIFIFFATLTASVSAPLLLLHGYITGGWDKNEESIVEEFDPIIYDDSSAPRVTVELITDEFCTVVSDNPVTVANGGRASFTVIFADNYTFNQGNGLTYYNGMITVENCTNDAKYEMSSQIKTDYCGFAFSIPDSSLGTVSCPTEIGSVPTETDITLHASPSDGMKFLCWTAGNDIYDGGNVLSYSPTYRFTITSDISLYPNFIEKDSILVRYDLGDGYMKQSDGRSTLTEIHPSASDGCINVRPILGDMYREGYNLIGYSLQQNDALICAGSLVKAPSVGLLDMNAVWEKFSDASNFEFVIAENGLAITDYKGDDTVLSIPSELFGLPVIRINAGAIKNRSFSALIIPDSVTEIENGAFVDCHYLQRMIIHDGFTLVSDSAFINCGSVASVTLNALSYAFFSDGVAQIKPRLTRIINRSGATPLIIFTGNDSTLYGINTESLLSVTDNEYSYVNASGISPTLREIFIQGITPYIQPKDAVIEGLSLYDEEHGVFTVEDIIALEGAYNLLSGVDITNFSGLLDSICNLNTTASGRRGRIEKPYSIANTSIAEATCYPVEIPEGSVVKSNRGQDITVESITSAMVERINRSMNTVRETGASYHLTYAPIFSCDKLGRPLSNDLLSLIKDEIIALELPLLNTDLSTYIYSPDKFYDSVSKLNSNGAALYSSIVFSDLNRLLSDGEQMTQYFNFSLGEYDTSLGNVEQSAVSGLVMQNQSITVSATPLSGYKFIGYTVGGSVYEGGEFVSYDATYSFRIKEHTTLYPNFIRSDLALVRYELGDGYVSSDGRSNIYIETLDMKVRSMVNLMGDVGVFERVGYTLLEYEATGNVMGDYINPGGLAGLDSNGLLTVKAVWSKWSDAEQFTYTSNANGISITGYTADEDVLSIPASINGVAVTAISANAFVYKSFHTLIIPPSIKKIESGAFKKCSSLDTLYIHDTVTSASNASFTECRAYSNLCLNAAQAPCYSVSAESITTRLERIISRDTSIPLMILVGGSSSLYGYNTPALIEGLNSNGYDVNALNCGTNASGTGMLYIEALSAFMQEGDIVLNAPEFFNHQMGSHNLVWRTLRATECCYNIYRFVDFSQYKDLLPALSSFNTDTGARAGRTTVSYHRSNTQLTAHGDLVGVKEYNGFIDTKGADITADKLNDTIINNINRIITILGSRGITYYFSSAPVYELNGAGQPHINDLDPIEAYYQKAVNSLNCAVISHPKDYIFPNGDYFNSNYHLTSDAALDRTMRVLNDLLVQFEKEGG